MTTGFSTVSSGSMVLSGRPLLLCSRAGRQGWAYGYGPLALLASYRIFVAGFFARHTTPILLGVTLGQLALGILLTKRGRWLVLGGLGGSLCLLVIVPLGAAAAYRSA